MREDMGRIGSGIKRVATLLYRAQFWPWAIRLSGRLNINAVSMEAIGNLLLWSGLEIGIGEWRSERSGVMGAFHPADREEEAAWNRFRAGTGPLPKPRLDDEEAA